MDPDKHAISSEKSNPIDVSTGQIRNSMWYPDDHKGSAQNSKSAPSYCYFSLLLSIYMFCKIYMYSW